MDFIAFLDTVAEKHYLDTNFGQEKIHIRKWWPFSWYVDFKVDSAGAIMPAGTRLYLETNPEEFKDFGQILEVKIDKMLRQVLVFRVSGKHDAIRVLAYRVDQTKFHTNGIFTKPAFKSALVAMLEQQEEKLVLKFIQVLQEQVVASRTTLRQASSLKLGDVQQRIRTQDLQTLVQKLAGESNLVDAQDVKTILQIVGLGFMPEHVDQAMEEMHSASSPGDAAPHSPPVLQTPGGSKKGSIKLRLIPENVKCDMVIPYLRSFEANEQGFALAFQIPLDYLIQLHAAFHKLDINKQGTVLLADYLVLMKQLRWDWLVEQIQSYTKQMEDDSISPKPKGLDVQKSTNSKILSPTFSVKTGSANSLSQMSPTSPSTTKPVIRVKLSGNSVTALKSQVAAQQITRTLSTLGKSAAPTIVEDRVKSLDADYENVIQEEFGVDVNEEITFAQLASFVCSSYASETKMDAMREIFMMIDLNGDGTVAKEELDVILRGVKIPIHHRERIMDELFSEDDSVGWEEFHEVFLEEEKAGRLNMEVLLNIKTAFDNLDSDGSGTVSTDEFAKMLKKMGLTFTEEELNSWRSSLDQDADGEITFFEFLRALCENTLMRTRISDIFSASNLASVDAYVLSSSVEEIEKVMDINNLAILPRIGAKVVRRMNEQKNQHNHDDGRSNIRVGPATRPVVGANDSLIIPQQVQDLKRLKRNVVVRAFVYGVISAFIAFVGEYMADNRVTDGKDLMYIEDNSGGPKWHDSLFYWHFFLKYGCAVIATGIEIAFLYYDMLHICVRMAEAVGITLYPLNPERAFLVNSFTNVALELGHPNDTRYTINPVRELTLVEQLFAEAAYKLKGGLTNFVGKSLAKRAMARVGARAIGPAVGIPIVSIINVIVALWVAGSVIVVCIGSLYVVGICDALLSAHRHLSLDVKKALLQAVSVAVVKQTQWHPNTEVCFKYLLSRLNTDVNAVENLGDAQHFLLVTLPNLKLTEQYLTLRVLSLAMILDGRLSSSRKSYLKKCLENCCFWPDLRDLNRLRRSFNNMTLTTADFLNLYASYHKHAGKKTESTDNWQDQVGDVTQQAGDMLIF